METGNKPTEQVDTTSADAPVETTTVPTEPNDTHSDLGPEGPGPEPTEQVEAASPSSDDKPSVAEGTPVSDTPASVDTTPTEADLTPEELTALRAAEQQIKMSRNPHPIVITSKSPIFKVLNKNLRARKNAATAIQIAGETARKAEETMVKLAAAAYPEETQGCSLHLEENQELGILTMHLQRHPGAQMLPPPVQPMPAPVEPEPAETVPDSPESADGAVADPVKDVPPPEPGSPAAKQVADELSVKKSEPTDG